MTSSLRDVVQLDSISILDAASALCGSDNLCSGERVRFSQGTARSDEPLHITEAEAIAALAPEWPDVAEIAR